MLDYLRSKDESERVFDEKTAKDIINQILEHVNPPGQFLIDVSSWWSAGQRWARNQASLTSDRRQVTVWVSDQRMGLGGGTATTNQVDPKSLKAIGEVVEYYAQRYESNQPLDRVVDPVEWNPQGSKVWSDETYNIALEDTARAVGNLTAISQTEKLLSAGYIEAAGSSTLKFTRTHWGKEIYKWGRVTQARCAATVRHPKGTGSGWAGKSSFDLARLDIPAIASIAFEKCKASIDPVRLEPGRYQTILEQDGVATLARLLVNDLMRKGPEEGAQTSTFLGADTDLNRFRSKLGLKLLDERITISHDPQDSMIGTHAWDSVSKITLVDKGILTNLFSWYRDHINELVDLEVPEYRTSFAIDGGNTAIDEMVEGTKRGLLVTRLSLPESVYGPSLLYTGVTRDGVWLIENGKITKAVRNLRWTESPLFAFNNLEQLGIQESVFAPLETRDPLAQGFHLSLRNIRVPAMKINDFSYTSTIDAI